MKKLFFTSCFLSLVFVSCENELVDKADAGGFSVSEAKNFYNNNAQRVYDDKGKTIDWENGIFHEFNGEKILEFPLDEKNSNIIIQVTPRTTRQDAETILENVFTRVVFIKKGTSIILRELHYVPNLRYLESKNYEISSDYFGNSIGEFKGMIITEDLNDKFLNLTKIKDSKVVGVWKTGLKKVDDENNRMLLFSKDEEEGDSGDPGTQYGPLETVTISQGPRSPSPINWGGFTPRSPVSGSNWSSSDPSGETPWGSSSWNDNGGGSIPAPEPPATQDCDAITAYVMSLGGTPTSDLISSEITSEDSDTKAKKYTWKFFQGPLFSLYSVETGVQVKVPNVNPSLQWQWQTFTHTSDYKVGSTIGINASYRINYATPTVGLYNATMALNYNVTYSAVCAGSGVTEDLNFNSGKLFNVYQ